MQDVDKHILLFTGWNKVLCIAVTAWLDSGCLLKFKKETIKNDEPEISETYITHNATLLKSLECTDLGV